MRSFKSNKIEDYLDRVIQGDTLDVLRHIPDNSVEMGVTSPPYNKGEKNKGWLVKNVLYDNVTDKQSEDIYQQEQIDVLNELYRIIKPGGSFFYNHKTRWDKGVMLHPMSWLMKSHWIVRQEIIWDRMIAANIRGWRFWQVDERIYWLYKPKDKNLIGEELQSKHAKLTSIWRFPPERDNPHPAPFPIELPTRAICAMMDEASGIVIDPYSGSGTTLVSAKLLNKHFIGIEISEQYADLSLNRLDFCEKERDKVLEEKQKHHINKTFQQRKLEGGNTGKFRSSPTPATVIAQATKLSEDW